MSTAGRTPGERACRYAYGAETVLETYARAVQTDLAYGLHMLAEQAAAEAAKVLEADDMDALEALSLQYCKANAVITAIAKEGDNDMLFAGEALMEYTKEMIDAEIERRMALHS
ncbi:MAG: hypothetical protein ACRYGA_07840 [Janthinobacterium lividum]